METIQKRALLAADTDRTQDYVFESARLPEIRGASTLLTRLNEEESVARIREIDGTAQKIFVGGGGLLYEVAADRALAIQAALERLYPEATGVATISCVYREIPENVNNGVLTLAVAAENLAQLSEFEQRRWKQQSCQRLNCFGAWVRLLGHDLRRRKQEKLRVPFVETPSHAMRCQSCRMRPAETIVSVYGFQSARCPECDKKNQESLRYLWRDRFDKYLREFHGQKFPGLVENYFKENEKGTIPLDLSVIASACTPRNHNKRNYVAFIYADGDRVGAFMENIQERETYQMAAQALQEATWYAVTYALARSLPLRQLINPIELDDEKNKLPRSTQQFEIITIGGDDVMLIVPAHAAMQVSYDLAEKFSEFWETKQKDLGADWQPISLSIGVVVAPTHMPVRLMRDFARELLKKGAKPRAKKEQCAVVDFQVFTSSAVYGNDVMAVRNQPPYTLIPRGTAPEKALRLYRRPYTLPELERLLEALAGLAKAEFPTSQLHSLAGSLEQGRQRASLFYLYQRSRLSDQHWAALQAVEAIVPAQESKDPEPWRKAAPDSGYGFSTSLRDVAELYDFVPDRKAEALP